MLFIDLSKKLRTSAATDQLRVEVGIPTGGIVAIYGRSGIGKSTLFNCIAGLGKPDKGRISFREQTWYDSEVGMKLPVQQRNISYIFQSNNLFPHLTVSQNVRFALKSADKTTDINELLKKVDLDGMGNRFPHQLSGGEQQKVAIARMLAQKPRLVLMDEPFSALDHVMRKKLYSLIKAFQEQYQLTVLLATHDLRDIQALAGQVLWIKEDRKGILLDAESFFDQVG